MKFLVWVTDEEGWLRPQGPGGNAFTGSKELAGRFTLDEATTIINTFDIDTDYKDINVVPKAMLIPEEEITE